MSGLFPLGHALPVKRPETATASSVLRTGNSVRFNKQERSFRTRNNQLRMIGPHLRLPLP